MITTALHPVDDFARAVRAALADLPADEVEDLTDGLEADLAERASDQDSPEFGDPVAYANELRSAAGLAPRSARQRGSLHGKLDNLWRELMNRLHQPHEHPLIARLVDFFVALRPLWWAFRAWVFYGIVTAIFGVPSLGFNLATLLIGVGSLIVSVQLGRGRWQPRAWMRTALTALNVLLVVTVPVTLLATSFAFNSQTNNAFADGQSQSQLNYAGLEYNGRQISNIFAYDATGKPLTDVQLFDQDGKPLNTVPDTSMNVSGLPYLVPNPNVVGRRGWNVYPLESVSTDQLNAQGEPKKGITPRPVSPTFLIVAPLANAVPTSPSPMATSTPVATPAPTPAPTPTPTPTN